MLSQRNIIFALSALLVVMGGYMTLKEKPLQPADTLAAIESEAGDADMAAQLANLEPAAGDAMAEGQEASGEVQLTPERMAYILGKHKHGAGVACKSEFPAAWSDDKIAQTVQQIASNDNLKWTQGSNGYFVAENKVEDLTVRVVVNRDDSTVVTAYPISVERNACPRREPANDNEPLAAQPKTGTDN